MTVLTALEIENAISNEKGYYAWPIYQPFDIVIAGETYPIEIVDTYEGDYDSTDRLWQVIKVDGVTYRKDGQYRSHEGSYWDIGHLYEVTGVDKVQTVWERV